MTQKDQILLNQYQNVHSVNVDMFEKIELSNKVSPILEYDIKNVLSATEIFDAEREATPIYRIYGRIEYLSLLNGLALNYNKLSNFFNVNASINASNVKTIFSSFRFYLVKPGTGYTKISGSDIQYIRYFEVIATPSDFEIYNAGYTNNVYNDQVYAFNFNKDFDVTPYVDAFGFPATELFLYAQYIPANNGNTIPLPETMQYTSFGTTGTPVKNTYNSTLLPLGSIIYGDLIEYSKENFSQTQLLPQTYYISTPYKDELNVQQYMIWKYNPLIPFRLRYFDANISQANTGTTSYEQANTIPYYATDLGNGNFVWRNILPQGYIDPLTNQGVDYPFINQRRYLFSTIILDVMPDLNDSHTLDVFTQIKFGAPTVQNTKPISDLKNIGKPCQ